MIRLTVTWYRDGVYVIERVSGQLTVVYGPMPIPIMDEFVREREAVVRKIIEREMHR